MPENNTSESSVNPLTARDWNEEWKRLQQARRRFDDASYWDKRSATFTSKDAPNPYVERFLPSWRHPARASDGVRSWGCATGGAVGAAGANGATRWWPPISRRACSANCGKRSTARGVRTVFPQEMSWADDWPSLGVRPGMVDVALASRSVATADLRDSLLRLTDVARRRVCVTLATGSSPRTDERILNAMGLSSVLGRDYLYAFNILANEGLRPEVFLHRQRAHRHVRLARRCLRRVRPHGGRRRGRNRRSRRARRGARSPAQLAGREPRAERARRAARQEGASGEVPAPTRAPNGHLGVHRLEQVERVPNGRSPFGTRSDTERWHRKRRSPLYRPFMLFARLTARCARTCRDPRCTRGR